MQYGFDNEGHFENLSQISRICETGVKARYILWDADTSFRTSIPSYNVYQSLNFQRCDFGQKGLWRLKEIEEKTTYNGIKHRKTTYTFTKFQIEGTCFKVC